MAPLVFLFAAFSLLAASPLCAGAPTAASTIAPAVAGLIPPLTTPPLQPPADPTPAEPAQSAGSVFTGFVPPQCNTALLAFAACLPSLASSTLSGTGIPSLFPSSACCSSLQSINPTCFCTLLAQAQSFFKSIRGSGGLSNSQTIDPIPLVTSAAYKLPSLCNLEAIFVPSS